MVILLICVAYIIIGSIFSAIVSIIDTKSEANLGGGMIVFLSVIWPLSLPIMLIGFASLFLHCKIYDFLYEHINCENPC